MPDRRSTGPVILTAKDVIHEPFLVINADGYYGKDGFKKLHEYMVDEMDGNGAKMQMCMAGSILANILSENGGVTRGICDMDQNGYLKKVTETYDIYREPDRMHMVTKEGAPTFVITNPHVSMNMFGLLVSFLDELERGFPELLTNVKEGDLKAEYLLPTIVDQCIRKDKVKVRLLETQDKRFGVIYKEDKPAVVLAIRR